MKTQKAADMAKRRLLAILRIVASTADREVTITRAGARAVLRSMK